MSSRSSSTLSSSTSSSPSSAAAALKRKAMSVTQTYYLAHTARGKLSSEAGRSDHNLRLLVGHANLLDSLMLELAEAEREQEMWFNQSVKKATKVQQQQQQQPKHIQWADAVVEDPEEDWQAEDADSSDSDSDYDSDEDTEMEASAPSFQRASSQPAAAASEEDEEEFGDEDFGFALHLTTSHSNSPSSPPELDLDSEDSSEDESMPSSPPSTALPSFSEKQRQEIATTGYYSKSNPSIPPSEHQAFFDEGFYLPQRAAPGLISAISVY